tara:strand:- start:282 stop:683 length:402 start_codon:yes stop_codon:yes gene_type:complete
MSNKAILFILIMFSVGIKCYNNYYLQTINHYKSYLGSQRYCPSTGRKTVYTSCIQDPSLNNAFIISVESIKNIGEIQGSLNKNDNQYKINKHKMKYLLINNISRRSQEIPICDNKIKKIIMDQLKTKDIYSSI